jgi:alkylation response protein AidB-like acyl-CoA dehydrogenase
MDFGFSDEQEALRATLRRFFETHSPSAEVRRLMESDAGFDPQVWKALAELGLLGVHLPEACGGQGASFLELGIAMEEMGRALFCGPYLSSVCLGAGAVLAVGSEADRRALLPGIAAGTTRAALAWVEPGGGWDLASVGLEVSRGPAGPSLHGAKTAVVDGATADLLLVVAREPGTAGDAGLSLLRVEPGARGVERTPIAPLDPTRKLAEIRFDGARAEPVGGPGAAGPGLRRVLAQASIALSAEMIGGSAACLDMAVGYARQRIQFARPIGSFQAIQHKAAEVLLEFETARSAVYWALWVAAEGSGELLQAARIARSAASDAYRRASAENLQIHGGVGFTWEADPQLHYKRAFASDLLFGDVTRARVEIARALGL